MAKSQTVIGFRVKTGWAACVLIGEPVSSPSVLDNRIIQLCDPAEPDSRQPYHVFEVLPEAEGKKEVRRLRSIVMGLSKRSVSELIDSYDRNGYRPRKAVLVVGSITSPEKIQQPHIRAHAMEGLLYRTAVEEALAARRIGSAVLSERHLYSKVAEALGKLEEELRRDLAKIGRSVEGPWRQEQKLAMSAAWMKLSQGGR